jgi:probable F420-dependent oxidoreductase
VKFSLKVPGLDLYPGRGTHWWRHIQPQELVAIVRRIEELGYDQVNVATHFAMDRESTAEMGARWTHSLSAAGFILGATTRLRVACLVVVPYHQPIELAKALSTLDFLSGGRLTVLALVGYKPWEFELLGVPFGERGPITDEYVEAMQTLWTQERPEFHGRYVSFSDVVFEPKPVQQPLPVWFGGRTKAAMRRIARFGDGWLPYATPRSQFREMVEHIYEQPSFQLRPRRLGLGLELFPTSSPKRMRCSNRSPRSQRSVRHSPRPMRSSVPGGSRTTRPERCRRSATQPSISSGCSGSQRRSCPRHAASKRPPRATIEVNHATTRLRAAERVFV